MSFFIMNYSVLLLILGTSLCKEFYDIDKSETVELSLKQSATFRISINIAAGLTYIPTNFERKLEFNNLLGTLVPGNNGNDYQLFEVFCTSTCTPDDEMNFSLLQTQSSHLGGHILHPVHVKVVKDN